MALTHLWTFTILVWLCTRNTLVLSASRIMLWHWRCVLRLMSCNTLDFDWTWLQAGDDYRLPRCPTLHTCSIPTDSTLLQCCLFFCCTSCPCFSSHLLTRHDHLQTILYINLSHAGVGSFPSPLTDSDMDAPLESATSVCGSSNSFSNMSNGIIFFKTATSCVLLCQLSLTTSVSWYCLQ